MRYLPFPKILLELINSARLLLKPGFEDLLFSSTRLQFADTSPGVHEFLLKFSLLLPYFTSVGILSFFQVLPVGELRAKLRGLVLSKLERTLEGCNLSLQSISLCGETSKLGGRGGGSCRRVRVSLSKTPQIILEM